MFLTVPSRVQPRKHTLHARVVSVQTTFREFKRVQPRQHTLHARVVSVQTTSKEFKRVQPRKQMRRAGCGHVYELSEHVRGVS